MLEQFDRVVYFDLEGTGTDPESDRIVEMAFLSDSGDVLLDTRVNPEQPIPPGATAVHGISDDDVADLEPFGFHADRVQEIIDGACLVGYNLIRYDSPLLDRELQMAFLPGLHKDDQGRIDQQEIDPYGLWMELEPRTLEGAVERFGVGEVYDAHSAVGDASAVRGVLTGLLLTMGVAADADLLALSKPEGAVDRDGKFVRNDEGRVVFNFGKHKGQWVGSQPGFLEWMLKKDFSSDAKSHARYYLSELRKAGRYG